MRILRLFGVALMACPVGLQGQSISQTQKTSLYVSIPRLWDENELAQMTLPPARHGGEIVYVSSSYFYRTPVLQVYKTYPVYHPKREPNGYLESLKKQEPRFTFDASNLKSERDWITAGSVAFSAPTAFDSIDDVRDPQWWARLQPPLTKHGTIAELYYVVRQKGKVELG